MSYAVKQVGSNFMSVQLVKNDSISEAVMNGYFVFNSESEMIEAYKEWELLLF